MSAITDLQDRVSQLSNQVSAATGDRDTAFANIKAYRLYLYTKWVREGNKNEYDINLDEPAKAIFSRTPPVVAWNPWSGAVDTGSTNFTFPFNTSKLPFPNAQLLNPGDANKNQANFAFLLDLVAKMQLMNTEIDKYMAAKSSLQSLNNQLSGTVQQLNTLLSPPETVEQKNQRLAAQQAADNEAKRIEAQNQLDLQKQADTAAERKRIIYLIAAVALLIIAVIIILKILT